MNETIRGIKAARLRAPHMRRWAEAVKSVASDTLLVMRVGNGYFMFGDDAKAAAAALRITTKMRGMVRQLYIPNDDLQRITAALRAKGLKVTLCGAADGKLGGHWRAHVDVTMGPRLMSDFMANAGLGITGCGTKERLVFNYAPGEEVGQERVNAAMENMIATADAEKVDFKILTYKVIKLEFINE